VDAIHRFIGKTELGVIPQVIDTVIFIKNGQVDKVLGVKMVVKVPSGMMEADLARPVIEIRDFATNKLEYEVYTYGEETVIVPVLGTGGKKSGSHALAQKQIEKEFLKYTSSVEAEMLSDNKVVVYIPERDIARVIGPKGATISKIEKDLGVSIDVKPISSQREDAKPIEYHLKERGNALIFSTNKAGLEVETYIDDTFLFTSTTSKKGEVKVSKKSNIGRELTRALDLNKTVELRAAG
ncbi:hypothetical protein HY501_03460, partial [Candidatus Woesearchaeota archaeon]|nr:hypothetical protein [Candidatus Woesearchaeota archaeon]